MSGYTDDILSRHGILSYKDRFLEKPFSESKLISKIREMLDDKDNELNNINSNRN
jgi:two-component system cell cycle sensor histidine kinase/response regulator CckA